RDDARASVSQQQHVPDLTTTTTITTIRMADPRPKQPFRPPPVSQPFRAQIPSNLLTHGAGVAIFHLRTSRVVVCHHSRDRYYFLPKGRKDIGESLAEASVREGFEESGVRCRLLPLGIGTRQTVPVSWGADGKGKAEGEGEGEGQGRGSGRGKGGRWNSEAVWTEILPHGRRGWYLLSWFVGETVPPEDERTLSCSSSSSSSSAAAGSGVELGRAAAVVAGPADDDDDVKVRPPSYRPPPPFPIDMTLAERIALEPADYVPVRHEGTGVDEEEACYESFFMDVERAMEVLGGARGSVQADVVRVGWEGIVKRMEMERGEEEESRRRTRRRGSGVSGEEGGEDGEERGGDSEGRCGGCLSEVWES
ncbi:hypothetical protein LTS18_006414, partial [Coniosporium uncinatum]